MYTLAQIWSGWIDQITSSRNCPTFGHILTDPWGHISVRDLYPYTLASLFYLLMSKLYHTGVHILICYYISCKSKNLNDLIISSDAFLDPVGIESGSIPDSSMTASSAWASTYQCLPERARLHFVRETQGGQFLCGGWLSQYIDTNQWLQVRSAWRKGIRKVRCWEFCISLLRPVGKVCPICPPVPWSQVSALVPLCRGNNLYYQVPRDDLEPSLPRLLIYRRTHASLAVRENKITIKPLK